MGLGSGFKKLLGGAQIEPVLSAGKDILGGITGKTGAAAAGEAGRLQSQAILEASGIEAEAIRSILPLLQEQMGLTQEQLGITRGQFQPFVQAGVGALPELQQGFQAPEGTTAGGLENIINQIMGGEAFGGLVEQRTRDIEGLLGAGGLSRSGEAITEGAKIGPDLAFQIENLLFGRQTGVEQERIRGLESLVSGGRSAAAGEAGSAATSVSQSGDITQQIINAITGAAGAEARGVRGGAEATASGILGGAQAKQQGIQNLLNIGGTIATAFSDPRLKQNIKVIGNIGPLDLVEWEWIPELDESFVSDFPTMGYLSTQVREHFPDHVDTFGGYDVINYPAVNEELLTWH